MLLVACMSVACAARASTPPHQRPVTNGLVLRINVHGGFVAPTYGDAADDSLRTGITRFTNPFNALGWPALALPCGPAEHGLPSSVQLVGRPGADALVLAAGSTLEAQVPA